MIRLIRAELTRFRSRLLVWVTVIVVLGLIGLVAAAAYSDSRPPSQETLAYFDGSFPWQPEFASEVLSIVSPVAIVLVAAAIIMGASFISAEIGSGALGNWLTFEPRRTRVFFAKLLGLLLGLIPFALGTLVLLVGSVWTAFALNDALGTDVPWAELIAMCGRVFALVLLGGAVGFFLGTMLRHTAAALGAIVGYLVIFESLLPSLVSGFHHAWLLISTNFSAWVNDGTVYYAHSCTSTPESGTMCETLERTLTLGASGVYFAVVALLLGAGAWWLFRRRDVN